MQREHHFRKPSIFVWFYEHLEKFGLNSNLPCMAMISSSCSCCIVALRCWRAVLRMRRRFILDTRSLSTRLFLIINVVSDVIMLLAWHCTLCPNLPGMFFMLLSMTTPPSLSSLVFILKCWIGWRRNLLPYTERHLFALLVPYNRTDCAPTWSSSRRTTGVDRECLPAQIVLGFVFFGPPKRNLWLLTDDLWVGVEPSKYVPSIPLPNLDQTS